MSETHGSGDFGGHGSRSASEGRWRQCAAGLRATGLRAAGLRAAGLRATGFLRSGWKRLPIGWRRFLGDALSLSLTLGGFILYNSFIFDGAKLPGRAFEQTFAMRAALESPSVLALFLVSSLIVIFRWRETSWTALRDPRLRVFITVPTVLLAFAYSAYDYNHFFDRLHFFDRALLMALGLATWRHPGFAAPATIVAILMSRQFSAPIGNYTWTDKRLLFDVLLLFNVYLCLHAFRRHRAHAFYTLTLVLIGGSYIIPAFTKLSLRWYSQDELWNLFVGAYTNDWLGALSPDGALSIAGILKEVTPALLVLTLVLELIPFVFLLERRLTVGILLACVGLHVGIFAASGIFFWKWITLDLALAYVFWRMSQSEARRLFGLRHVFFWASLPAMFFVREYATVMRLGWLDTELNTTYHFEAVGESGRVYPVSRSFFSPYDVIFAQNRFQYLSRVRNIPMTYGVHTREEIGLAVKRAQTAQDIAEVERTFGRVTFNGRAAARFDRFIKKYFASVNVQGRKRETLWGYIGAPHHIYNFRRHGDYWGQEPVVEVRVRMKKQFFRADSHLDTLYDKEIRVIPIPQPVAAKGPAGGRRRDGAAR
ncbi:MAG: hypothetical protein AAGN82_02535 [Myxococcota bacterium]